MTAARSNSSQIDSRRLTRWVWRASPLVLVVAVALFWMTFSALRVPAGMDALHDVPPGSLCIIDKRSGSVQPGSAVFVDLPEGGTVLSRVREITDAGLMRLANDDPAATTPDSEELGMIPLRFVRGVVLVVFAGDGDPGEEIRGR